MEAALEGAREIGFTIVSMTASLAAVFLPVLFMGGIVGPAAPRVRGGDRRRGHRVRRRVADPHPDAVQPLPAAAPARPTAGSTRRRSASSAACCALYERTLQLALRHPRVHPRDLLRDPGRDRLPLHDHPQGLHPQRGHRAGLRVHRGRAGHLLRGDDGAPAQGRQHRAASSPTWRPYFSAHRGQRLQRGHEHRPHLHAPQARHRAAAPRTRSSRTCGGSSRGIPGINVYPQVLPTIRIGGQLTKGQYQYTLQDADLQALYQWAPILYARMQGPAGLPRRQLAICRSRARRCSSRSTARRPPRWGSPRCRSRPRSTTPTARRRSPPSTPRPTSTG